MSTIAFIGYRGSGKSTLGAWLAGELDIDFIDTDDWVLASLGFDSVTEAWEKVGEKGWREAELHCIPALFQREAVIALGGGAPMFPGVAKAVAGCKYVFNLTASADVTRERIEVGDDRPALAAGDAETRLDRLPTYAMLGTIGIETSGDIDGCKKQILEYLKNGHQLPKSSYRPQQD
ncbi:MAG: shikimate kinase [Planctomycetes bacterium]|nr:shikimate kinase [Planctomycetota bacterium]